MNAKSSKNNNGIRLGQFALWVDVMGTGNKLRDPYTGPKPFEEMWTALQDINLFLVWTIKLYRRWSGDFEGCAFSDGLSIMFNDLSNGIIFLRLLFKTCFCNGIWLQAGISVGNNWKSIDRKKEKVPQSLQLYPILSDAHYEAFMVSENGPAGMKIFASQLLTECINKKTYRLPNGVETRPIEYSVNGKNKHGLEIRWTDYTPLERSIAKKVRINTIQENTFNDLSTVFLEENSKWKNPPKRPIKHLIGTMSAFEWGINKMKKEKDE